MQMLYRVPYGIPCIYEIVNLSTQKRYVGSTFRYRLRFREHRQMLESKSHHSVHLQRSYNKHGKGLFVMRPLEIVADGDAILEREQFWIDQTRKADCYNQSVVAGRSGRDPMPVYSLDPISGEKNRYCSATDAAVAVHGTELAAGAIRKAARLHAKSGGCYWTFRPQKTLEAIVGQAELKKEKSKRSKPKCVFCFDTNYRLVGSYANMSEAARAHGVHPTAIREAVVSSRYRTAAGLIWSDLEIPRCVRSKKTKRVKQKKDGETVAIWDSLRDAASAIDGASLKGISSAATGYQKSHRGYEWEFVKT